MSQWRLVLAPWSEQLSSDDWCLLCYSRLADTTLLLETWEGPYPIEQDYATLGKTHL